MATGGGGSSFDDIGAGFESMEFFVGGNGGGDTGEVLNDPLDESLNDDNSLGGMNDLDDLDDDGLPDEGPSAKPLIIRGLVGKKKKKKKEKKLTAKEKAKKEKKEVVSAATRRLWQDLSLDQPAQRKRGRPKKRKLDAGVEAEAAAVGFAGVGASGLAGLDGNGVGNGAGVGGGDVEAKMVPGKMYDLQIRKGLLDGRIAVTLWDKVRSCVGDECKLFKECPYFQDTEKINSMIKKKENGEKLGACRVEQKYLFHNLKPFLELLKKVPDEFVVQIIGMHLVPLYHDLIQLKMEKATLRSVSYVDAKGTRRINPVFDQLLKTHTEIMKTWKTSGLLDVARDAGFFKAGGQIIPSGDDILEKNPILDGDPHDYAAMSGGGGVAGLSDIDEERK
jgi:hypothetical protein